MEWKARAFRGIHSSGTHLLFLTLFLDDLMHKSISVLKNKHMQQIIIYQIMSGFKVIFIRTRCINNNLLITCIAVEIIISAMGMNR